MEDKRVMVVCEICREQPMSEVKGGMYQDTPRKLWFVCKECKKLITDQRRTNEV